MVKLNVLPPRSTALDQLEIATPCQVPWESLAGESNRVRHCGHCRQNVYNIEALPRAEALRFIEGREGRLCLRIFRRPDGTVVTADCWERLRAARRKGILPFLLMLVVVGCVELVAIATGLESLSRIWPGGHTQGEIRAPRTPTPPAHVMPRTLGRMRRLDATTID